MTDLEKRVKEYVETKGKEHFRKFFNEELSMADLLKKCCVEFAQSETALLSKHILELQTTNGALTDRVNELEKENKSLESIKNIYIGDLLKAKELLKWALHSDPEHDEDFEQKWQEAEAFINKE